MPRARDASSRAWPSGVVVEHATPAGGASLFARASGAIAATIITSVYILVPFLLCAIPALAFFRPWSPLTWALAAPLIASALAPPIPSASVLRSWPFKHMPTYFAYTEIKEIDAAAGRAGRRRERAEIAPTRRRTPIASRRLARRARGGVGPIYQN